MKITHTFCISSQHNLFQPLASHWRDFPLNNKGRFNYYQIVKVILMSLQDTSIIKPLLGSMYYLSNSHTTPSLLFPSACLFIW